MLGFTVTLTDADTNYNLLDLVKAIDANYIDDAAYIIVQATSSNTAVVLLGDVNLSATRFGAELNALDSVPIGPAVRGALVDAYVRSGAATQKVNLLIQR